MTRISGIFVIFGRTGEREGVVPADGVTHHLDQRPHVFIVIFGMEPGTRKGRAHQGAGRRGVEPLLDAIGQGCRIEGQEVRTLPAFDVDDLDVVARPDPVGAGLGGRNPEVESDIGQRRRQDGSRVRRAFELDEEVRRGGLFLRGHRDAGRRHHGHKVGGRRPAEAGSSRMIAVEDLERASVPDLDTRDPKGAERRGGVRVGVQQPIGEARPADRPHEPREISGISRQAQEKQFGRLQPFRITDAEPIAGLQSDGRRSATPHDGSFGQARSGGRWR